MDSIVNKLTEIEDAASAIVQHAEDQKDALNREYDEKRRAFDAELEQKTEARRAELESRTSSILDSQSDSSTELIRSLRKEYEEKHTEYAREILKRITEV